MEWTSPTGFEDPDAVWSNEANAYDENVDTYSQGIAQEAWGSYLILTVASPIVCAKLRFNAWKHDCVDRIDVDVYNSVTEEWVDVYEGTWTDHVWEEKTFTEITITKMRLRFRSGSGYGGRLVRIYECDFFTFVAYTVTITESLGMLDSTTKIYSAKQTITEKLGMLDSQVPKWDAHLTVSDKIGMLDTLPTKGYYKQVVSDMVGIVDSVTRKGYFKQTISDILGLMDTSTTKAAFHLAVNEVFGMLDSVTSQFLGVPIKIIGDWIPPKRRFMVVMNRPKVKTFKLVGASEKTVKVIGRPKK